MEILKYLSDIPILVVLIVFVVSTIYCSSKYCITNKNLNILIKFMENFKKNDLNFRYKEIDEWMKNNPYVSVIWTEFKNTLVFSESIAVKQGETGLKYQNISSTVQNIQTTTDPLYFFNEETLVTSKFNFKMVQTIPTVLTGFGPLFTFLNIAIAFGRIDFSTQEKTIASVSSFMTSMQTAALVSVIAVGSSLIYLMIERILYNKMCKTPVNKIQEIMSSLFASISAEKFLYELLRETKVQNNSTANLISEIPTQFKTAFNASTSANLVPYLENLIFGLNQLNKQLKESINNNKSDVVDELF
ncbi:MAG: hypothetical protein NC191_01605 [Muribaculaceae bacterium]|nr:hypothetical protein [Muribaculaceae bacterium]